VADGGEPFNGRLLRPDRHRQLAEKIGLTPLFDLEMGEAEGTGAALAAGTVKAAALIHSGMLAANTVEIAQMEQSR
jgi:nicotinate-nucleotide--dimethylbenzimidazole phosphoribosyltransferase